MFVTNEVKTNKEIRMKKKKLKKGKRKNNNDNHLI